TAAPEPTASGAVPADVGRKVKDIQVKLDDRDREVRAREIEIDGLHAELGALKKTISSELSTFRSGRFDPVKYIEETAMLSKQLQTEIAKRKELEEEIDHIKKGSIAVIKYVKAQQLKSGVVTDVKKKLQEESVARRQLEIQLQKTQEIMNGLKGQIEKNLVSKPADVREMKQKELALVEREAGLKAREAELAALQDPARRPESGGAGEDLRQRFEEELREKDADFLREEDALKRQVIIMEEEVNKYRIEEKLRAESAQLKGRPKGEVDAILSRKEME